MAIPSLLHELRPCTDPVVADRLARSAAALSGAWTTTADARRWLAERTEACQARVRRIPFDQLDRWSFEPGTGNLRHDSGKFFTVEGLDVVRPGIAWQQPIIVQPEIGILGLLAAEFDGVLHFLMQAKMEPGNPNLVQFSPTVQATRSNYTQAHGGADVRYLDHFRDRDPRRVITDVLQSEHASWFFRKSNRNMIVEADGDVPVHEDFCWLTLGQIGELMRTDHAVNMDTRTVIASAPMRPVEHGALSPDVEVLAWLTGERTRQDVEVGLVPLDGVRGWRRGRDAVHRVDERFFRLVAVAVESNGREVRSWTQPLIEPVAQGVVAFAYRRFDGAPHLLVEARVEGGFLDTAELGPTVQALPANYAHLPAAQRPRFLDLLATAPAARVRYAAIHSEEGGRFLNADSRYLIVETDEATTPTVPPAGFCWVTQGQLNRLAGFSRYVNVQARTLLAVLNSGAVTL